MTEEKILKIKISGTIKNDREYFVNNNSLVKCLRVIFCKVISNHFYILRCWFFHFFPSPLIKDCTFFCCIYLDQMLMIDQEITFFSLIYLAKCFKRVARLSTQARNSFRTWIKFSLNASQRVSYKSYKGFRRNVKRRKQFCAWFRTTKAFNKKIDVKEQQQTQKIKNDDDMKKSLKERGTNSRAAPSSNMKNVKKKIYFLMLLFLGFFETFVTQYNKC